MEIKRDRYLKALTDRMHNGMVKVVTGVRRIGKSYLLFNIFCEYLKNIGVDDAHIITIELDRRQNRELRDPDRILAYIESLITDDGQYYVILDEVQMLEAFEEVLNSLLHLRNVDIYVTGSNSKFLSKDVIERHHIEKTQELEDLINVLASSVGSLTNPSRIEATFRSATRSKISLNTIRQYIEYLEEAYIICKAHRYDVKGRKYIGTPLKYYFEDVGLRNARLGFRQVEENHLMENVIFNELRSRGYIVDVGVVAKRGVNAEGRDEKKQLEIGFVANKGTRRYYIQSALSMPSDEKRAQEKAALVHVRDSFKKIIVVRDVVNVTCDAQGIVTMSLFDFLLRENSLEL